MYLQEVKNRSDFGFKASVSGPLQHGYRAAAMHISMNPKSWDGRNRQPMPATDRDNPMAESMDAAIAGE